MDGSKLALCLCRVRPVLVLHPFHRYWWHSHTHNTSLYIFCAITLFKTGTTTSGHFGDTRGLIRYDPCWRTVDTWSEAQKTLWSARWLWSVFITPSGEVRKQASKEQHFNMRKKLVMKFTLQARKVPKRVERKCGR